MSKRVVLVTGSSGGIGRACVERFTSENYAVCAADLTPSGGPPSQDRIAITLDVTQAESCRAAVDATLQAFGRIDALVHMAGAHSTLTWRDLGADEFARVMAVNVTGAFLMCQAAALAMERQGTAGAIVLASSNAMSVAGLGGNGRGGPAYVSTKAAIVGLTRALARSLAPLNIRVNAIAPGSTRTPMTADYSEEALKLVGSRTLAGRIGEPEEMAAAASYLISPDASYVFGEILNVNGGGSFGL